MSYDVDLLIDTGAGHRVVAEYLGNHTSNVSPSERRRRPWATLTPRTFPADVRFFEPQDGWVSPEAERAARRAFCERVGLSPNEVAQRAQAEREHGERLAGLIWASLFHRVG